MKERFIFVGDSPNDAPMFEYFPYSVGVANVREFGDHGSSAPKYVTDHASGAGFAEIAGTCCSARTEGWGATSWLRPWSRQQGWTGRSP